MGIGLVDPILPVLAVQLDASRSQVSLLFPSYLVVTAVAMLVTGWVSSRLGAKRTLLIGLALIVVFSLLAGLSATVNGIACGPLVGGVLGNISWRGPFFGVAVLMGIALVATVFLLPPSPKPARSSGISSPLKALRHRGLAIMGITGLLYNWGLFTLLAYSPYLIDLGAIQLGFVFFGWGVLLAFFAVVGAPRLQARFGTARTLYGNFVLLAIDLAVIGVGHSSQATVIVAVIVAGAFLGVNNTLVTQAVMMVSPVERPVASASYGFVRFIGGGLAPYVAGTLAEWFNDAIPFYLGAITVLLALAVFASGHALIEEADRRMLGGADEIEGAEGLESIGGADTVDGDADLHPNQVRAQA